MAAKGGGGALVSSDVPKGKRGMGLQNPFTLKVGQVFTGFGVGCGIGIGVGRPLNLGAIPVLNQIMVAARGATDAFSGVQRPLNNVLRKVGARNIEAGIGCGVGFGHGFGVGLAVKPGVLHQIQSSLFEMAGHVMMKLGVNTTSELSVDRPIFPALVQTNKGMVKEPLAEDSTRGVIPQSVKSVSIPTSDGNIKDWETAGSEILAPERYNTRAEEVLNNFLKNPLEETNSVHKQGGQLQMENAILQMVLKHQVLLEELKQENDQLRRILVDNPEVLPTELVTNSIYKTKSTCNECFECRRRQRKR